MLDRNLLLLDCIRASLRRTLSQNDIRRLFGKIVNNPLAPFGKGDWDRLLSDAQSDTGPLLYHMLKEADVDGLLPEWFISKLEMAYYSSFSRSVFYYRGLRDILGSFHRSGIQVITFKGAALAETLYPSIALRPFGDIDLLIRDQDLFKAESELQRLGYEKYIREFRQGYGREFEKYSAYLKRGRVTVYIDLHTRLFPFAHAQKSEFDGFWDRAVATQIDGVHSLTLSAEDTVLHLCVHIFRHGFPIRLLWLYDLALMILKHGRSLNWKLMEERARTLEVHGIAGFVLDQVRQTLDISLPQGAVPWVESYELDCVERLSSISESSRMIWYYALRLRSVKGAKDRLRFIMGRVFPSRDYIMWRYSISNSKLVLFGYCCHLYRIYFIFLGAARAVSALTHKRWLSRQSA
jgi:hypothetical protein